TRASFASSRTTTSCASRKATGPARARTRPPLLAEPFADERSPFAGKLFFAVEHPAPDLRRTRELGQAVAERLDNDPAVIADLVERGERRVPVDLAAARRRTVVLRDVHVDEHVLARQQRLA